MQHAALVLGVRFADARHRLAQTMTEVNSDDRGEGVVSVAIAVLIMAALGTVAWAAFRGLFNDTVDSSRTQIDSIGNG